MMRRKMRWLRADERFGNAKDVDERGIRSRCQVLVDRRKAASQPAFSHENPSSLRVGARHNVTMTSPPPGLQQIAGPAPAYRMAALLLGSGVRTLS